MPVQTPEWSIAQSRRARRVAAGDLEDVVLYAAHEGRAPANSLGNSSDFPAEHPLPDPNAGQAFSRLIVSKLKQILICDDDSQILRALTVLLRGAGFGVVPASTAGGALDVAALHPLVAAIIDLWLPDGDGVEVCRRLREWSDMPILVLSGDCEETTKVRALDAGADDYLSKPFAPGELIARLRANLRRGEAELQEPVVNVNGLEVDLRGRVVHHNGTEVQLTPIEYELLRALIRNRGRLMTHSALLHEVWGSAYEHDKQTLQTHVANLRRKIDPHPQRRGYIRTDFGVGYRFVA